VGRGLSISAREEALHRAGKRGEKSKLLALRQWKSTLREHPDDEFFGFVE
jgi:hypothetical protein